MPLIAYTNVFLDKKLSENECLKIMNQIKAIPDVLSAVFNRAARTIKIDHKPRPKVIKNIKKISSVIGASSTALYARTKAHLDKALSDKECLKIANKITMFYGMHSATFNKASRTIDIKHQANPRLLKIIRKVPGIKKLTL